jgi:predicted pyridoxine 5'-phosphate oxidase superfamily flavin-nucleotide-binding protein
MSEFYGEAQRKLQDRFDTRRLADRLTAAIVHDTVTEDDKAFIESRDMVFLSTVGADGQPTVSYKGGAAGFVRVLDEHTLAFPSYDGNGMFLSMGNIAGSAKVGLLFIDFQHPHRVRLHGEATVSAEDPLLADYPGADLIVRVRVTDLFVNCPRYIHPHDRRGASRFVPGPDGSAPTPAWKRIDAIQDALPARDADVAAAAGGVISIEDYGRMVQDGTA